MIRKYAKKWNPEEIVMGMRDRVDLFDRLFGTITLGAVKTIENTPIYSIPGDVQFTGFKKILIASDHHFSSELVERILRWNQSFNAFLSFYHVADGENEDTHEKVVEMIGDQILSQEHPHFGFEVHIEKNLYEVTKPLLQRAEGINCDLIMLAPGSQTFFESLFVKSVTKDLILKASFPLLFWK